MYEKFAQTAINSFCLASVKIFKTFSDIFSNSISYSYDMIESFRTTTKLTLKCSYVVTVKNEL